MWSDAIRKKPNGPFPNCSHCMVSKGVSLSILGSLWNSQKHLRNRHHLISRVWLAYLSSKTLKRSKRSLQLSAPSCRVSLWQHNLMQLNFHISQRAGWRKPAVVLSVANTATGCQTVWPIPARVEDGVPCIHCIRNTLAQLHQEGRLGRIRTVAGQVVGHSPSWLPNSDQNNVLAITATSAH